jgi:hypothetical protein
VSALPLRAQEGETELIASCAAIEGELTEQTFTRESELFQDAHGSPVSRLHVRFDPVELEILEAVSDD